MSFTATGPILLLLALYVFAFKPSQLAYFAVFFAPFSATAIINLGSLGYKAGGLGVTPAMTFTLFFFASHFVYGYAARQVQVTTGHLIQMGVLLVFLTSAYVSFLVNCAFNTLINPVTTHSVYITIGIGAAVLFSLEFTRDDGIEKVVRFTRAAAIFVCLWGLMQLICSLVHIPYPSILFNNSNSDAADMFAQDIGAFSRISSVAVEPSVMAASLLHFAAFGVTLLSRDARLRTRYWYWPVALVILTLLLSTSSTAYVGLLVIALLILLERPVFALLAGVPALTVFLGILTAFPKALDILLASTIYKSSSYSYSDRTSMAVFDYTYFLRHPLLGWGWGRATNFNGVTTLLCNVGLIGSAVFVVCGTLTLLSLTLSARAAHADDWKMASYAAGVRNALIVAAVCAVTSGMKYVFLDDWVFWGLGIAVASRLEIKQRTALMNPAAWIPRLREGVAT